MPIPNLAHLTLRELLDTTAAVSTELRSRGYVRTGTSLPGELMEHVTAVSYGGTLEAPANQGWDVRAPDGRRIQVKTRNLADGVNRPFSFKNLDFDAAVLILTDINRFEIVWAREVTLDELEPLLIPHKTVGYRLTMYRAKTSGADIAEVLSDAFAQLR